MFPETDTNPGDCDVCHGMKKEVYEGHAAHHLGSHIWEKQNVLVIKVQWAELS